MTRYSLILALSQWIALTALMVTLAERTSAQSTATLIGQVSDPSDNRIPGAQITLKDEATGELQTTRTNGMGLYLFPALSVGTYRISVNAPGFRVYTLENLTLEVGRTVVQDFKLTIGDSSEQVTVNSDPPSIDRAAISFGTTIEHRTVQEIPLNGRFFLDLAQLTPGSMTASQNGSAVLPVRGAGAFAINTAGNREETVNFMINGITLNDLFFGSLTFQPALSSLQEFRLDNSTFSAEYGQSSGAIVNIATRSGTSKLHGELFEFLRNDAFDARNFFDFTSRRPPPFKRNQFGGSVGGPLLKNRTFFFFSYEALRQRQGVDVNSLVLSDSQRESGTDPVIARLMTLIRRANYVDSSGTPRFIGSASAPVDVQNWAIDIYHELTVKDRLHGYYAFQKRYFIEPTRQGNTVPGFGDTVDSPRQILTLNETRAIGPSLLNEARIGFNRLFSPDKPTAQLNPVAFGIVDGVLQPIGLPQISIAGSSLNFGGPKALPSVRGDTTFVLADTLNWRAGLHSIKFGGEFRQFLDNISRFDPGTFEFPTVASFLADSANSFSVTLGDVSTSVAQGALGFFVQDNYMLRSYLTFELGVRYDWNMKPSERYDRFIVFDPASVSLLRADQRPQGIYDQNDKNIEPRVGFAWDPFRDGRTSVRAAYAILTDEPLTSVVTSTSANPPLAVPLTFTGPISLDNAINLARAAGLAPATVNPAFKNAYMQSWNLNVQRQIGPNLNIMVGYFGSKGTHLILRRNINQPIDGVRPYPALSASSPILPGTPVGNIAQVESDGNSSYNALWISVNKRLANGLQFNASYTFSKSIDYNSLSSQGIVLQNSYDLRGNRGLSDFDARQRFVLNTIYELPVRGSRFVESWELAAIFVKQSGNPINIVTSNSTVNGVADTVRPDLIGPIKIIGNVDQWFDTSVFTVPAQFGNLGRNVVIGPGFNNTDFSVIKTTKLGERERLEFRAEFFDVFNHANLGQPGNVVGTPDFGRITRTRFPTGESGSSRQIQFALKLMF
jgi:hypothetical protein